MWPIMPIQIRACPCTTAKMVTGAAIANSIRAGMGKGTIGGNFLNVVYANPLAFHDISQGANGACRAICMAGPGYDFVTGLGSPMALQVVDALTAAP
jgi:hypothetical protein